MPDQPGGGTVSWTNPWGEHRFFDNIEAREDGGTPAFLQTIKAALSIKLKDAMQVSKIQQREEELVKILLHGLRQHPDIRILEDQQDDRLCIVSFYVLGIHHNLLVRLLNDQFGIQTRGGCSCAGTYGHLLLGVDQLQSHEITHRIDQGDLTDKPGWVRVSLHPTNTDDEAHFLVNAILQVIDNAEAWSQSYDFDQSSGEFRPKSNGKPLKSLNDFTPL